MHSARFAGLSCFPVLVNDAVYAPIFHSLAVVDMHRGEAPILLQEHFHHEQCHGNSNY